MSKSQTRCSVQFALCAAILVGLAVRTSAQNRERRIDPEKHFTIAPDVRTPMALKTLPYAVCSLHSPGNFDAGHGLTLYANGDGYVQVHLTAKRDSQETALQLDCNTADAASVHPLHLHTGFSPAADRPAPDPSVPTPTGSRIVPALTEQTARLLSNSDLTRLGYPPRPDPTQAPALYSAWLDVVSRPMTLLPPNEVSHTEVTHQHPGVEEATAASSANWSGLELRSKPFTYVNVSANWTVPVVDEQGGGVLVDYGKKAYSALWVGLDGDPRGDKLAGRDLVQDGTESDATDFNGVLASHCYAWTELVPTQPTAVPQFTVAENDKIFAHVWVGDSHGNVSLYGLYYWFYIADTTNGQAVQFSLPYSNTDPFTGAEAEWIMERPTLASGKLPDLANYVAEWVTNAAALDITTGKYIQAAAANRLITMYDSANNVLSSAVSIGGGGILFNWHFFN